MSCSRACGLLLLLLLFLVVGVLVRCLSLVIWYLIFFFPLYSSPSPLSLTSTFPSLPLRLCKKFWGRLSVNSGVSSVKSTQAIIQHKHRTRLDCSFRRPFCCWDYWYFTRLLYSRLSTHQSPKMILSSC